jgi:hypothetical protein
MGDTFCEQYHLRHLHHSTFAPTIQSDNSLYDICGRHGRMVTPAHSVANLDDQPRNDWQLLRHVVVNFMIVPNTVLLIPDGLVDVFQFLPDSPDRTVSLVTRYVARSRRPTKRDARRGGTAEGLKVTLLPQVIDTD